MPTIKEQIEHLKTYDPDTPCAMHLWLPEDVKGRAVERGKHITDEQTAEVLDALEHHCDSSIGISWDNIDAELDTLDLPPATCKEIEEWGYCNSECDTCEGAQREPTAAEEEALENCEQKPKPCNIPCQECPFGKTLFDNMSAARKIRAIAEHRIGVGADEDETELQVK